MILIVVTQEIEIEPFLVNELKEITPYFSRVIIITTQKSNTITHNYETIISKRSDYFFSCILYSIKKLFSKEAIEELRDRKNMRVKPGLKSMIRTWILTWMIEKRLQKYLNKIRKDEEIILYSYWLNMNAYFVAKMKKRNPKIMAISRAHGFEVRDFDTYIPFRKVIDTYLDKIIFISEHTQSEYESIMKKYVLSKRAERKIVRLGINKLPFQKSAEIDKSAIFNIVSCSGIYRLKRLDLIIDSLASIQDSILINWIHFGSGNDYEIIFEYAKKKLTKGNINFKFRGQLSNLDLLKFYESNPVDLFINTSDHEGIPVSIMEAMAFGIPCVARNIGGNSEIVKDQISGRLLPKNAGPLLIAQAIEDIYFLKINDFPGYLQLRNSTCIFWEKNFQASKNFDDFYRLITKSNQNVG
jgi:glycosyltransferase involved in cell wall biosynthesis